MLELDHQILLQKQQYELMVSQFKHQQQNLNQEQKQEKNQLLISNSQPQQELKMTPISNGQQGFKKVKSSEQQQQVNTFFKNQDDNQNSIYNQLKLKQNEQAQNNDQKKQQNSDKPTLNGQNISDNGASLPKIIEKNGTVNQENKEQFQNIGQEQSNKNLEKEKLLQKNQDNNEQQQQAKIYAYIKPIVTKEHVQVHKHLRNQIRRSIQMDHGTEEGCKVLKGKRIEFIVHNNKKKYVFIQFAQTNFDAASEGKMINMLYKRLDLKKSRMEEEIQNNNTDNENSVSDEDRQIIFSEDSLNSNQQEQSIHAESVFPNFINENCFIFKKKSTPNGLVLDQVLYSDKIIKYIGYDIQEFQLMAVNDGTPTLLQGRESFYSMMKIVQKQANYYLSSQSGVLQSDNVNMVIKTQKNHLIYAECTIQCSLVEGSFYVKIEIIKTLSTDYQYSDQTSQNNVNEYTAQKLKRFSPHEQEFLRKYIKQTPENELEHNKDKICGFKFVNSSKEKEYVSQLEQFNQSKPKGKKTKANNVKSNQNQKQQKLQDQKDNDEQQKQKENIHGQNNNQHILQLEDPQKETQNPMIPNQPNLTISYNQPSADYTNNLITNNFDISDDSDIELDSGKTKETAKIPQIYNQISMQDQQQQNNKRNQQNSIDNQEQDIEKMQELTKKIKQSNGITESNLVVSNDYELQQLKQIEKIKQQQQQLQINQKLKQQQQNQNGITQNQDVNSNQIQQQQSNILLQQQQQQLQQQQQIQDGQQQQSQKENEITDSVNKGNNLNQVQIENKDDINSDKNNSINNINNNDNDNKNNSNGNQINEQKENNVINQFISKNTGIITLPENIDDEEDEEF
ncbi:hypothetical protein PPERSA_07316 [Pseudocohnilembus persalinus]|uniref:Uncharacterized protein n=1 Tax=Pseudocohnilembus persalinus TaxID=266149 RepID=A0A0V0R6W3_PSEPJ|nr:hypothetical protein PPERSA_07316 [Pseudocohnilembus persalinus]|eukprot:KRX10231.1 hypothetical protein PPERSA_07316 [Pseudocohnilembus persalinus]